MNHTKQTSFILYHDFEPMLQLLSMEQRGMLITAIFDYSVRGMKTEDLPDVVNMAFCCIQRALERDAIAYEEKCRINAENGKKGGRPRKDSLISKTEGFFEKAKKAYSDNDSDNDNDNVNVNDSESVNGNEGETSSEPLPCSTSDLGSAFDLGSALPRSADIEAEEKALEAMGVPLDYAKERWERARVYGALHGQGVGEVLLSWWREDERRKKPSHKRSPPPMENKSYDLEDFLQAALEGSYRALDVP